jgi:hypothetical protein
VATACRFHRAFDTSVPTIRHNSDYKISHLSPQRHREDFTEGELEKKRLCRQYSASSQTNMRPKLSISRCLNIGVILAGMILATTFAARGELLWESSVQEFERTPGDGSVEAHYGFKNIGSSPVTILRIGSSCGCTVAQTDKKTYLPGESGQITARFSFGNRKGLQRKVIAVGLSDGTEKQLALNVSILEPLTVRPALLLWRVGENAVPKTVQLTPAKGVPLTIRSVSSSNPRVSAQLHPKTGAFDYTVTVTPIDTAEKLSTIVMIETNYPPDAPKSYQVHVHVK